MTRIVLSQFPRIEHIRRGATAKRGRVETKEHHSSTKRELSYTLIPAMGVWSARETWTEFRGLEFPSSFFIFMFSLFLLFVTKKVPSHFLRAHWAYRAQTRSQRRNYAEVRIFLCCTNSYDDYRGQRRIFLTKLAAGVSSVVLELNRRVRCS